MIKIVFVCLGNICRSPMAQSVFTHLVKQEGLSHLIKVDSAATSNWEDGNPIYPKTIHQLNIKNIPIVENFSRQLSKIDEDAQYIIGMDASNVKNIKNMISNPNIEIKRLLEYANIQRDIADPWYTDRFDIAYHDVITGCKALLNYIIKKHELKSI